jgi:hypothetical protein
MRFRDGVRSHAISMMGGSNWTTRRPERALRGVALGRKNYLFAGSDAGGERAGCLYSLLGTAKLNGLDPELYLRIVLEGISPGVLPTMTFARNPRHIAEAGMERAARGRIPATIPFTAFLKEATLAKEAGCCLRSATSATAQLASTKTNNPTGKPYIKKEAIPGSLCIRYCLNLQLWDSAGNPLAKANKESSRPDRIPADVHHTDQACLINDDDEYIAVASVPIPAPVPMEFLPDGAASPSDNLARKYWAILDYNRKWIGSGAAWSTQFETILANNPNYTSEELSKAMDWAADDHFWGDKIRLKSDQTTPYFLTKTPTILTKYRQAQKPSGMTSTHHQPQHVVSYYAHLDD